MTLEISDFSKLYINRELSWLEFNARVLEEALDNSNPLLERVNFLSITSSNLDEFFMVRVSSLIDMVEAGLNSKDPSGLTPSKQLELIGNRVHEMVKSQYACLNRMILPSLKKEGVVFVDYDELEEKEKEFAMDYFYTTVYPILTPMAIDQGRPFPLLNNKALVFLVEISGEEKEKLFALLQVPTVIERVIALPGNEGIRFIMLEDLISKFMGELFLGYKVNKSALFRITRSSDLYFDEEDTLDLMSEIEESIKLRKWGKPVRLEIHKSMSKFSKAFLQEQLDVGNEDIYEIKGFLDLTALGYLNKIGGLAYLKNPDLKPVPVVDFIGKNIFEAIKERDILVHHPYESFDPVTDFIRLAATDSSVLAIKQTLYRVSGDSPILKALMKAAENGKQVTALVELKARFDEENNITWAKRLERSGCHVIYGLVGLKTHCKACLIVRKETDGIRRYVHLGTGNYNDSTAKTYTDLGYFTCKESFGRDISLLFNSLTGYSNMESLEKLVAAPLSLRDTLLKAIKTEAENAKRGEKAKIIAKLNSLVDEKIIKALYAASVAGVQINLIVRGICCLRSAVEGVSENIKVVSIIDRFLEHSRIYYFENGGNPKIYLSSADWMPRNFERRVEIAFPIEDDFLKKEIHIILETTLADKQKLRIQKEDGSYERAYSKKKTGLHAQIALHSMQKERYNLQMQKQEESQSTFPLK